MLRALLPSAALPEGGADPTSFEEFWPHYMAAHRHPLNRALHYSGTSAAVATALLGVFWLNPVLVVAALPIGYGPAWLGHLVFERNRPATFTHPLWSLRGDFKMLGIVLESVLSRQARSLRACWQLSSLVPWRQPRSA